MNRKVWFPLLVLLLMLSACVPLETPPPEPRPEGPVTHAPSQPPELPAPGPYDPGKGDESMERSQVFINSQEIQVLESFPPQFQLHVTGSLPTPCHELRAVVDEPDAENQIHVQIYSLVDPNVVCVQVLEPFEANISLGSYVSGTYTVFVNGEEVGEITS